MEENKPKKEELAQKSEIAKREEEILEFWRENKIFEKTLAKDAPKGGFTFYDGPPFATGAPHYGHLLAGTMKDAIPRYKTMRGYKVSRKWGWDCHGLPIENLVEKELGLKSRKDIEDYGIEKFNEAAEASVFRYAEEWKKVVPRLGRFVDMEKDYRTMDWKYMESILNVFASLHKKKLIYEGFKSMHLCPRCETTLSNLEVSQNYKDITDLSVVAEFELTGEPNKFVLAWTTTPWTLPGNVALAVHPDTDYAEATGEVAGNVYIVAQNRLQSAFGEKYKILRTFKGKELIGKSYKPVFDYYSKDEKLENRKNGWKIYGAGFVTTEDGTGVVHIAPAFGEDDMNLGKTNNMPFIQHVGADGKFKPEVADFAGLSVKPKGNPRETDEKVVNFLKEKGLVFEAKDFAHSYPFCYRCETPLLNYASSSWFVDVQKIKAKLIEANKKIGWIPPEIRDGRFGKWLLGARDWAISRSRFWGAPLPVWKCEKCGKIKVVGGVEEIRKNLKPRNKYIVMRHGQSENNSLGILSLNPDNPHHLTSEGMQQVADSAKKLKKEKINLIFASPFVRTKETAELVAEKVGLPKENIFTDGRLREITAPEFEGKPSSEYGKLFQSPPDKFEIKPVGGENYAEIKQRTIGFISETDKKFSGKTILIVTHDAPAWLLYSGAYNFSVNESLELWDKGTHRFLANAEFKKMDFVPLPRGKNNEINLHKPYIDEVIFACECGGQMTRVPEVFDCWFESGSMPYAQSHYPFENLADFNPKKNIGFPADFIAEGLDQTRGWFYSMLVLSAALFGKTSYKNVIVNGIILAENGQKMSKRLKNYPDPMIIVDKYGADALRYFLLNSPSVRAEDMRFSEKAVDEVYKKNILRLLNVFSFYSLYSSSLPLSPKPYPLKPSSVLDSWILSRLSEITGEITEAMENYELDRASRPFENFIDDLSVWYLRRSRDRFKGDDEADKKFALQTLRFVLLEISKLLAPFMPFLAEDLYKKVGGELESVHLENWPASAKPSAGDAKILEEMTEVRKIVSLGLEARAKAGIKVRQPLRSLKTKNYKLQTQTELVELIRDELNIKEIVFDDKIVNEVELDTFITPELEEEGWLREFVRTVQELRKTSGLTIKDFAELQVAEIHPKRALIEKYKKEISKSATLKDIVFVFGDGAELKLLK